MTIVYINPPKTCNLCSRPISDKFYDARTSSGVWANMCFTCFHSHTDGQLGTGRGQKYKRNDHGHFEKVKG
jgi:hypothetical protein